MLGTVVNTLAIIAGSLVGLLFRGGIPERYSRTVQHAVGLAVILIGLKTALQTDALLVVILSLALGSAAGELMRIEGRLETIGNVLGRRLSGGGGDIAKGFVHASRDVFLWGTFAYSGNRL